MLRCFPAPRIGRGLFVFQVNSFAGGGRLLFSERVVRAVAGEGDQRCVDGNQRKPRQRQSAGERRRQQQYKERDTVAEQPRRNFFENSQLLEQLGQDRRRQRRARIGAEALPCQQFIYHTA